MNKTRSLYKAFSSNLEMPKPNGEKKVKLYNRFGMSAFIGIMVPVSVIVGYVTYVLTDLLHYLRYVDAVSLAHINPALLPYGLGIPSRAP